LATKNPTSVVFKGRKNRGNWTTCKLRQLYINANWAPQSPHSHAPNTIRHSFKLPALWWAHISLNHTSSHSPGLPHIPHTHLIPHLSYLNRHGFFLIALRVFSLGVQNLVQSLKRTKKTSHPCPSFGCGLLKLGLEHS